MRGKFVSLIGQTFGKLTVIGRAENVLIGKKNNAAWECLCICGGKRTCISSRLKSGDAKSCGCDKSAICAVNATIHGCGRSKIYSVWYKMHRRCYDTKDSNYPNYGGRGIIVCESWHDVQNFTYDMEESYREGLTLDRINNNGNYEPSNCKWSTAKEQAINRRTTKFITYKGETKTMEEWGKLYNLSRAAIKLRIKRGWDIDRLFTSRNKAV